MTKKQTPEVASLRSLFDIQIYRLNFHAKTIPMISTSAETPTMIQTFRLFVCVLPFIPEKPPGGVMPPGVFVPDCCVPPFPLSELSLL